LENHGRWRLLGSALREADHLLIGSIAVADSDPNVIYAGTGEACIRGNISFGDGVYRSNDAGKTWTNVGLKDTRHIGKLIIHPTNPDVVFVAALGMLTARTPNAASSALATAAKTGKKFSISTTAPAALTSFSIPAIPTFFSPPCGRAIDSLVAQ